MDPNIYGYVKNDPVNDIDPLGLHGLVFFGRGPYIFRPLPLRPAPKYVPRPIPKTTPKPKLRRVFRPPPQIVRPQPKPWWYWFLRLVKPVEDIVDPPLDLYPFVPGMDNNIDPCGRHYT